MKKKILMIVSGMCLLVILGVAAFLWFTKTQNDASAHEGTLAEALSEPRPVLLEKISLTTSVTDRSFPGVVNAVDTTQLSFRIHGPLIEVNVKPGDAVKKGQVLMQVDPRDFQDRIQVLEAQLARTSAQYRKAAQDFKRATGLFAERVIPPAEYDSAESAHDAAAAAVKDLEAQLQTAKHQLDDSSLLAPYDGIITKQHVENHEMISAGQVVLGMHDISRLEIEVEVPENEIAKHQLRNGESSRIQFPSARDREYPAALKEWNTSADPVTRTYTVVFVMEAPTDASIFPGMTAQAKWASETSSVPVAAVPARAIVADTQGRSFVWVFDPQSSRAQKRLVETGTLINSHQAQILKGVEPGEFIVSEGAGFITETMELRPLNFDTTAVSSMCERSRP